jgi:hypothetical protein
MIAIAAEASLPPPHPPQMASGRLCALLLQHSLEVEQPPFDCLPLLLAQEAVGAKGGRTCDAQIDADDLSGRRNVYFGDTHNNVQPPFTVPLDQVGGIGREIGILGAVVRNTKGDGLSSTDECQRDDLAFPIDTIGALIVARWGKRRLRLRNRALWVFSQLKSTSQRLGSLHACLDQQVARQIGQCIAQAVVGQTVQLGGVGDIGCPSDTNTTIECLGCEGSDSTQRLNLRCIWFQSNSDRALHLDVLLLFNIVLNQFQWRAAHSCDKLAVDSESGQASTQGRELLPEQSRRTTFHQADKPVDSKQRVKIAQDMDVILHHFDLANQTAMLVGKRLHNLAKPHIGGERVPSGDTWYTRRQGKCSDRRYCGLWSLPAYQALYYTALYNTNKCAMLALYPIPKGRGSRAVEKLYLYETRFLMRIDFSR